jgi:hypothetical protein
MLPLKETFQVAGIMLHNSKTLRVQIKFACRKFSPEFYLTFPLAFVFRKLKSRWAPLRKRFKGCNGKKKYYQTGSAQCRSVFVLI